MSARRNEQAAGLPAYLRFALCAAGTTWAALLSWRGFTSTASVYLTELVLVGLVVAVTGAVARWRRLPALAVVAAQLALGLAVTCQLVGDRPYPGAGFWSALSGAVDAAGTYAAPVPHNDTVSVQPLLLVGGFLAVLAVDVCAASLRRVPLAGLPLLTVYSVPISLIDRGLSWWVFVATATGFLLLLFQQEEEHLARWGRSLEGADAPGRRLSDSVRSSAIGVATVATAAAVVLPLAVPTFSFSVFDMGPGTGGGDDIEVTNPMVDLRQDLVRGDDIELVRLVTDDPEPDHLRISVLNRFTDNEWSAGDRSVPKSNLAQGEVPSIAGTDRSLVSFESAEYQVEIAEEFRSRWLPTQAPIVDISAEGDWRYDPSTLDFLASVDDLDTAGLRYDMTAALPTYRDERLLQLDTSPSLVDEELTDLPDDLPASIAQTAREATRGATTDFQAAVLLNQFFRSTGGFEYELPSDPGAATGTGELVAFLDPETGRTGYCEQFSAAMAVLARTLGIPARVAVGFLTPSETPADREDGAYVYRSHDLHAWVELYFPGAGWVLFDPTPPDRVAGEVVPTYTQARVGGDVPDAVPTAQASSEAPSRSQAPPTGRPDTAPTPAESAPAQQQAGASFPWAPALLALVLLALLVVLALAPRWARGRQRERRLAAGPESAWEELRATALDLGRGWPEGRSPRETRDRVVEWFGRPGDRDERPARGPEVAPGAVAALDRVAGHLERQRYARRHDVPPGSLRADVELCCAALEAGATPRVRRRARWLPVTAFQRRRVSDARSGSAEEPELVGASSEVL